MSGMTIEGEPTRRYRLNYHGSFLGSYNTAREALEKYETHDS